MRQYMEFYYPSSGKSKYDIGFKWGTYYVTTHARKRAKVRRNARRYRGYVTLRPTRGQSLSRLSPVPRASAA